MKVFNLQCGQGHAFEGWFASEVDFLAQVDRAQLECPLCGDAAVTKKLSAPRVLRSGRRKGGVAQNPVRAGSAQSEDAAALWLAFARQIVATTTDVGTNFAEEARKIHYGETSERGIRGTATREETQNLLEEGIGVLPFPMPEALKRTLQ